MNKVGMYSTYADDFRVYRKQYSLNFIIEAFVIIGLLSSLVIPSVSLGGMAAYLTVLISRVICSF